MEYFYVPSQGSEHPSAGKHLTIDGDEFNHLTHVMRKNVGDAIRIVDGKGNAFDATIAEITKRSARCLILANHSRLHEPEIDVTVASGLLKNPSSFDFLVEKVTELGVNAIIPLVTERTIPQHAKTERWQKLALAAMKQSGRCVLPAVHELTSFADFMSSTRAGLRLIPHEKTEALSLSDIIRKEKYSSVTVCVGPEGGFSDEEIALATKAGFIPVSLGARRLRTETAAIVAAWTVLS